MKIRTMRYKLRQSLYSPRKSRFFTKKVMKEIDDIEKNLEKLLGKKKRKGSGGKGEKKGDSKKDKKDKA